MIQTQMLSYLLKTKDVSIINLNGLTADYFSDYISEYNFIKSHVNKYDSVPDPETFLNVFNEGKADAALAATVFHFNTLKIKDLKSYLNDRSVEVRLW